ncbi:MAG: YmdB family metallophosphoesterase, partial [Pseudomonadota bacterium]
MRILFLGDVVGRAGRKAIAENLPKLRESWRLDFVVVNAENATGGMGLSGAHAQVLLEAGAMPSRLNKDGWNCLHIAAREGHALLVGRLLD